MAYKITKDYLHRGELKKFSKVGTGYKIRNTKTGVIRPDSEMPYKFRLKDDDGVVYFHGISNDCSSEKAFDPLDDMMPQYGCTIIEYKNARGDWEIL